MMKIVSPADGANVSGNQIIAATMLNPAVATTVDFKVNGVTFETVDPALAMTARLDTLSLDLPNGPATVTVQSIGNVYTATRTINVNNPRSIYVDSATGSVGSFVVVLVKLNNYATVAKCQFSLNFDPNRLQLDTASVTKGSGVPVASTLDRIASSGLLTVTISGATPFVGGDVLVAHFQIRSPSPVGTRNDIGLSVISVKDSADNSIATAGVTGSVTTN